MVGGEQLAGAAESGGDLVEDQQHVVAVADGTQVGQVARIVEAHPARALHHGFDDDRGEFVGVPGKLCLERRAVARGVFGGDPGREHLPRQHVGPQECMPPSGSQTLIGVKVSP